MPKAKIHRRSTLEEVYPPDVFASDAAKNGRVPKTVLSGVRILSAPDAAGDFEFERATQQIGEAASASFLARTVGRKGPKTRDATVRRPCRPTPIHELGTKPSSMMSSQSRRASASSPRNPPAAMNRGCAGRGSDFHLVSSPKRCFVRFLG
jgi:hypothetical protein